MKVKLKDPQTTFYDPESKLKVAGDDVVEIDSKARKGKLTLAAIAAGGLIEVKTAAKEKADAKDKEKEK